MRQQEDEDGSFATITNLVDSAAHKADTVPQAEVDNDPKPIEADESFDDFVYSYASDDALQRQRTKFPLPFTTLINLLK